MDLHLALDHLHIHPLKLVLILLLTPQLHRGTIHLNAILGLAIAMNMAEPTLAVYASTIAIRNSEKKVLSRRKALITLCYANARVLWM